MFLEEDNESLETVPSEQEKERIVFEINASSALGPDGFNGPSFQECSHIIKADMVVAVQSFFRRPSILIGLNSNVISLILK